MSRAPRPKAVSTRHKWPDNGEQFFTSDPVPFHFKTERTCLRCDLTKTTVHEMDPHAFPAFRVEWWRDGEQINSRLTPLCDARLELVPA